jgi:hypothetical protein
MIPVILAVQFFTGCVSEPMKPEPGIDLTLENIKETNDYGKLVSQLQESQLVLQGKDPKRYAADFSLLEALKDRIVEVKKQDLVALFKSSRLENGLVPLSVLNDQQSSLEINPIGDPERWAPLVQMLDQELDKAKQGIKEMARRYEEGKLTDKEQLLLLDDLYRTSGNSDWMERRKEFVDGLIEEIRQAKRDGLLSEELKPKLEIVKQERAENKTLIKELIAVDAAIYQQDYFNALSNGDADKAYQILVSMSQAKDFTDLKSSLADTTQKMVDYFVALADESVKDPAKLPQSYRLFSQAKDASEIFGLGWKPGPGQDGLLSQLFAKYKKFNKDQNPFFSLAYLYGIKDFSPTYKNLEQKIVLAEKVVRESAVRRLSTTAFRDIYSKGYGDVIASNITQYIFQTIPNDISIVEREQYEAIQRERSLGRQSEGLSAVDLLVTGSILEAKVDLEEEAGKKLLRVTVGQESIPNPAYIAWIELKPSDRRDVEKPSEVLKVDKQENISVKITQHRKIGLLSISYRLVDAASGSVLFPDSVSKERKYSDTSSEGVEMGDFILPFKLANLPSDVKILDELAEQVSSEIGRRLVEQLSHQEKRYIAKADRYAKERDCFRESENLAKALAILEAKSLETVDTRDRYKRVVFSCGS